MLLDEIFFDQNMTVFCSKEEEDLYFEEIIEKDLSEYLTKKGINHVCIHNPHVKSKWKDSRICPVASNNLFNLRDITNKENAKILWPQKVYIESEAPATVRIIRRISKSMFADKVPYIYMRDWCILPYYINLVRYRILKKDSQERVETVRDFLIKTIPEMKKHIKG